MTVSVAGLMPLLSGPFWLAALVFLRVSALVSLLPAVGEQTVPVRVKLGVAIMFTLIVAPTVAPPVLPPQLPDFLWFALTETLLGLALGLSLRLFVLALQTTGSMAAQSMSLAQILGGAAVEPIPAMGYVLVLGGLTLATISGLHVEAARFVILSYEFFPIGQLPDVAMIADWGVGRTGEAFALAFMLAAPFVIASVVYNLALGVINRAMPQLMVAFVGAPVITWGGLFLLFAGAPILLSVWSDAFLSFLDQPDGTGR